ncbi:hypothetical protein [Actinomadura alba]|uniref:Small secreted hydrophilic protein n=1 Tax=Actinomadura alba TaxID=406431 RepID=A0ABR7LZ58_9ACTN|nr:hypothetical protein [Actinomadura alba]MBC6470137.1 hypothetical protein [Actinomadura alba]
MNVQWIATVASIGALGGLFLGVGLPVLQQPEAVAPINVVVPVAGDPPAPRVRADDTDDDADDGGGRVSTGTAEQDDDRDDRPRRGPVSGDGDDGAADDGDDDGGDDDGPDDGDD